MKEKLLEEILKSIDDTILLYDGDKLIYRNHEEGNDQIIVGKKNINFMNKEYSVVFLGKTKNNEYEIDDLTGVLTKGAFKKSIMELNNEKLESNVIVFCDIDNLKKFNERYGHVETDKVIKNVANIMKKNIRSTDIIGRFGGDEFVILLKDTNILKSFNRIEKIRKMICETPYNLRCTETGKIETTYVSMTFGMALVEENISKSLVDADDMLVNGKKNEKNKIYILEKNK